MTKLDTDIPKIENEKKLERESKFKGSFLFLSKESLFESRFLLIDSGEGLQHFSII